MNADQRLINESWAHLQKTGKCSVDGQGNCCYSGSGCAMAPVIIEEYRSKMDDRNITACGVLKYQNNIHPWATSINPVIANSVQECHDEHAEINPDTFLLDFATDLKRVCKSNELTPPKSMLEYIKQNESTKQEQ